MDLRDEKMGYKIREAQIFKIPYMLVIGDQEQENGKIKCPQISEQKSEVMPFEDFLEIIKGELK